MLDITVSVFGACCMYQDISSVDTMSTLAQLEFNLFLPLRKNNLCELYNQTFILTLSLSLSMN